LVRSWGFSTISMSVIKCVGTRGQPALGAQVVAQPLDSERPSVESTFVTFYDQRFAAQNDVNENQFLKRFDTLMINHVAINAHHPFKVRRRLDQTFDIEVRRDGLERCAWSG
jgi:hypothetical protein